MQTLIDRIRHDIQERLDQLLGEADKLRRALLALGSREDTSASAPAAGRPARAGTRGRTRSTAGSSSSPRKTVPSRPGTPVVEGPVGSPATAPATTAPAATARARTAPGATKQAVLAALSEGQALTAGDVAAATGLGRATVSTTLSKLAKSGEVTKAARGYQLTRSAPDISPGPGAPPKPAEPSQSEPT